MVRRRARDNLDAVGSNTFDTIEPLNTIEAFDGQLACTRRLDVNEPTVFINIYNTMTIAVSNGSTRLVFLDHYQLLARD